MIISSSVTVTFEKVLTIPDFWDYLIYNFLVNLHGDMSGVTADFEQVHDLDNTTQTNNENQNEDVPPPPDPPPEDRRHKQKHGTQSTNTTNLIGRVFLHENLLLGPPRLRQIRVRKDSCYVNDAFIRYFNTCYSQYTAGTEEIVSDHMGAPFRTMRDLDSTPLWTQLNFYRSGGYTVDLTFNKKENLMILKKLRNQHWLDRGSRLCLIEFNLFNENTDTFQSAK